MQLTAFGARDRSYFGAFLCSAPRQQLMRNPLDGTLSLPIPFLGMPWLMRQLTTPEHEQESGCTKKTFNLGHALQPTRCLIIPIVVLLRIAYAFLLVSMQLGGALPVLRKSPVLFARISTSEF